VRATGGLGQYLNIDPTLIRLGFVLLAIFGGHGLLMYFITCVVVPPEPEALSVAPSHAPEVIA